MKRILGIALLTGVLGGCVVAPPAPGYYGPAPRYVAPPAPVVVVPSYRSYAPAPGYGWGYGRGWGHHDRW